MDLFDKNFEFSEETGPKKPVARRRVDTIPRKPVKVGKGDSGNNDSVVKNTLLKQRRRDSNLKPSPQVGRRTKLKRKLESRLPRTAVRRKVSITKLDLINLFTLNSAHFIIYIS